MPNTPAQFPNFDLPGAEWFGLAPNANIAIQGRRRSVLNVGPTNIPASSSGNTISGLKTLEAQFPLTAGLYIHRCWLWLLPGAVGFNIQVTGAVLGINNASGAGDTFGYPAGEAAGQFTNPQGPLLVIENRDILVTARDMDIANGWFGTSITGTNNPTGTTLNMAFSVWLTNGDATVRAMFAQAGIVYSRLDGFTE